MTRRRQFTMERLYQADLADVWDLWTTKEGIESWWGPEGFVVTVRRLDLRPGGTLDYVMTAVAKEQIAFLERANMKIATEHRIEYTEVTPHRRLAYTQLADFVPGVAPYDVKLSVDFELTAKGVRMLLTSDVMHDDRWTQLATMGWESELNKLGAVLASHAARKAGRS